MKGGEMLVIGIDPGQSGGIAFHFGDAVEVCRMPATERDLYELLNSAWDRMEWDIKCFLEKVGAMPGQGIASTWKFAQHYGSIRMALVSLDIPLQTVAPRVWQKAVGIVPRGKSETKTQFKNRLKARAQELFPKINVTLATCDALLIAEYGRREIHD